MEEWSEVYKYNKKMDNTVEWLLNLLEEEKIPYRQKVEEVWIGHPTKYRKYEQNIILLVPKEYKVKVESYIRDYSNPNNIIYEDAQELQNAFDYDDEERIEKQKRNFIKKIIEWIPIILVLIIIICLMFQG